MKKHKLIIIISLFCAVSMMLSSCGFVRYVKYNDVVDDKDLDAALEEYIEKIDGLVDIEGYRKEEQIQLSHLLQDAKNELRECTSVEELELIFAKHEKLILSVPSDLLLCINEVMEEIGVSINLADYREAERKIVEQLIKEYGKMIRETDNKDIISMLARELKAEIYYIKTDAQYLVEELAALMEEKELALGADIDHGDYRTEDREKIIALVAEFASMAKKLSNKDAVNALYESYAVKIGDIPTMTEALKNDQASWKQSFKALIDDFCAKYSLSVSAAELEMVLKKVSEAKSAEEAARHASSLLIEKSKELYPLCEAMGIYIDNAITKSEYRTAELEKADANAKLAKQELSNAKNVSSALDIFDAFKLKNESLSTNDELWLAEDTAFKKTLADTFEYSLVPPESLTKADSYEELAAIIDYYAFYQMNSTSFLRDTFRVELNFSHRWAQWEINEVYWYCELIRSAVGIKGHFETDSSQFVIELIPYDIASVSNTEERVQLDRFDTVVEYSTDSVLNDRSDDFEDFPYLSLYSKKLTGVWSTQQLWYALEHEYIPVTVDGSPADICLERAKDILREVIKEGMTAEEKIYAIYSWFGRNVRYDYDYEAYLYPDNRDLYPDSLAATLNSFHVEGALLDGLAVCCSYAKACLVLMRMEGLEAYRVFVHIYTDNAIGNLGRTGFGSHAYVIVRASDGNFYYCDTERSALEHPDSKHPEEAKIQTLHQLLVHKDVQYPYDNGWTNMYKDIRFGEELPMDIIWKHLTYDGKSIFVKTEAELKALLDAFDADGRVDVQLTVFTYGDISFSVADALADDGRFSDSYKSFEFGGLAEYTIYK